MRNRRQFPGGFPGGGSSGFPGGFPGGGSSGFPGGFPSGESSGFPGGFPGGGSSGFPGGFPGGESSGILGGFPGGQPGGAPMSAPPQFIPHHMPASHGASMRVCLHRNTYVWMNNGSQFWFFPTFVSRRMIVGFRWSKSRFRWIHHTINPSNVRNFQCF